MSNSNDFLYRGVNCTMFQELRGELRPKKILEPFEHIFLAGAEDEIMTADGSITAGPSSQNAVIRHQLNQAGYPTSGISTTPFYDRAIHYATDNGKASGYVYKIAVDLLGRYGINLIRVSNFISLPSIPEDDEYILVANDYGVLHPGIVFEVTKVEPGYSNTDKGDPDEAIKI